MEIWMKYEWNMNEIWIFILKNLKKKKNRRKIGMTWTRAVWKDFQTLLRTRAGGPTLYEGRARARARARAKYPEIFTRFCIYCQLLELPKNCCGQNNSRSASVVGPEEEREPLGFRTFFNHHDVVMMMTRSAVLRTLFARVSWRKNRKCVTKPVLKHHTPGFLRHETPARSALKSAPVHALLRDPLREHFRAQLSTFTRVSCIEEL